MSSRLASVIELLHAVPQAALGTHSTRLQGYPFTSAVSFVPDEHHRPVMLLSGLAEHSRNLQQDSRASLMVAQSVGQGELARATLVGDVTAFHATEEWVERYLRYQPEALRLLGLGNFGFVALEPLRIQIIGGFAKAGWLEGSALNQAPAFTSDEEAGLRMQMASGLPEGWKLLGIDAFGADFVVHGQRERIGFEPGPAKVDAVAEAFALAYRRRWGPFAPGAAQRPN